MAGEVTSPRRFYERAEARAHEGEHAVALDGRLARSPGRRVLAGPRPLAAAMADEWARQGDVLDMASMPLTRLHGRALDADAAQVSAWRETLPAYAGTDLLCYRDADPALAKRQAEVWQPLLDRAGARLGQPFAVTEGVMAVTQPPVLIAAIAAEAETLTRAQALVAATLTEGLGSAVLALDVVLGGDVEEAFAASRLDESFQRERWGADAEAMAAEEALRRDMTAAARYLALACPS